jgi:hypothetical protein
MISKFGPNLSGLTDGRGTTHLILEGCIVLKRVWLAVGACTATSIRSAVQAGDAGLERVCLVYNRLTLCQRLAAQIGKIDIILNCVENNINGILDVVVHSA